MKGLFIRLSAALLTAALLAGCGLSPDARRNKFLARGQGFYRSHDYTRAVIEFRNALGVKPKDPVVLYNLGLSYSAVLDYKSAFGAFQKAISIDPNYIPAQLKAAEIMSTSSDPAVLQAAQERLLKLAAAEAATPEMLNSLAFVELKMGEPDNAIKSLEKALLQSPSELGSAVLLARAKLIQKDPKGAEGALQKFNKENPSSTDGLRVLAELYIGENRLPEAEPLLRRAIEMAPKNRAALLDLARLLLTAGRKQEAEEKFKDLSKFEENKTMYAIFLFQDNRHEDAIRELTKLVRADPEDRTVRTYLIQAYRYSGKPDEAEKLLAAALKKNPHDADALLQRAEVLIQKGVYDKAELDLNQVLRLRPTVAVVHYAIAKLKQAQGNKLTYRQELAETLRLNWTLLPVRIELAQSLVGDRQGQGARDILDEAPPGQKTSLPWLEQRNWALWAMESLQEMRTGIDQGLALQRSPDLLIQDGLWKLRAGNPAGARAALEEALKLNPSDLRALETLKRTYIAQKNGPMALQRVKEYAAKQPKSAGLQEFLGMMLMAGGDRKEARAAFTAAREADPRFLSASMALIQLDAAEGKLAEAHKELESVISQNPNNLIAKRWLGNIEEMRGNHVAAIDHFQSVVAASPRDSQAANNLAYLLVEYRGQTDEALKLAQKAVELSPNNPSYCDTLGWILYKKGLYQSAIPYFERASADLENVVWQYHLAMAYGKVGNTKRGRVVLAAALRADPGVPEAKIARELLGEFPTK